MSALSLDEAKAYLNIQSSNSDAKLQATIDAAEAALGQRVGPIGSTTVTRRLQGCCSVLNLPITPVISLTSVTPYQGTALTVTDLYVDKVTGLVTFNNLVGFPSLYYDVVYEAGRSPVPGDLIEAIRALVEHMWQPARGPRSTSGDTSGNLPGAAHALPYRVQELIAPYVQVGVG